MKSSQITKKDSDVVVIRKIAQQAVQDALKESKNGNGKADITSFSYGNASGGFGTGGGTGLVYTISFKMFGVSGSPTVLTYKSRQKLTAEGGVHLYDYDATNSIAQIRLNPANNPILAYGML